MYILRTWRKTFTHQNTKEKIKLAFLISYIHVWRQSLLLGYLGKNLKRKKKSNFLHGYHGNLLLIFLVKETTLHFLFLFYFMKENMAKVSRIYKFVKKMTSLFIYLFVYCFSFCLLFIIYFIVLSSSINFLATTQKNENSISFYMR